MQDGIVKVVNFKKKKKKIMNNDDFMTKILFIVPYYKSNFSCSENCAYKLMLLNSKFLSILFIL